MTENVTAVNHPLVATALSVMRNKETSNQDFRRALNDLSTMLVYEACRNISTRLVDIETPVTATKATVLASEITLVPILRAGLGMLSRAEELLPMASVAFMGMARDEKTHEPHVYLESVPQSLAGRHVVVLDPMLATGGSLIACLEVLQKHDAQDVTVVCALASPEGLSRVCERFADVKIVTGSIDERLNENAFIVPGLGDAGDRRFGAV